MSFEIRPNSPVRSPQRTPSPAYTDGSASTAVTTPTPEAPAQTQQQQPKDIGAYTLREVWQGFANFVTNAFKAVFNFIAGFFRPSQPETLDPDSLAIAQAYNLYPSKENVQAFLNEAQSYEKNGAVGPGAPAESVKVLQEGLKKLGYNVNATGEFDQATTAAVIDFKKRVGVHQNYKLADGSFAVNEFADQATLQALQQALEQGATPTSATSSTLPTAPTSSTTPATPTLPTTSTKPTTPTTPTTSTVSTSPTVPTLPTTPTTPTTPSTPPIPDAPLHGYDAIIKQYDLLATQSNVDAFLAETKKYKTDGTLGPGMDAPGDIRELQTILSKWGYAVNLNGNYDEQTAKAIIQFKKDAGIHQNYKTSDGNWAVNEYADQATLAKMMEMVEKEQKPAVTTPTNPITTPTTPTTPTTSTVPTTPTTPASGSLDFQAIAKQHDLLATQENVETFLKEIGDYEKNGSLGPGVNAPEDIKELQTVLARWGYAVQATGQYDAATCEAVMKFKKDNGISQTYKLADGSLAVNEFADPKTLAKIVERVDKELAGQTVTQATTPTTPTTSTTSNLSAEHAAIAKQYNLLGSTENVQAFLTEVQGYETSGALGPGVNAPEDLKELQTILKGWGYAIDVNGSFDEKTAAAILKFKQENGLHQTYKLTDGNWAVNEYADQQTLRKILEKAGG